MKIMEENSSLTTEFCFHEECIDFLPELKLYVPPLQLKRPSDDPALNGDIFSETNSSLYTITKMNQPKPESDNCSNLNDNILDFNSTSGFSDNYSSSSQILSLNSGETNSNILLGLAEFEKNLKNISKSLITIQSYSESKTYPHGFTAYKSNSLLFNASMSSSSISSSNSEDEMMLEKAEEEELAKDISDLESIETYNSNIAKSHITNYMNKVTWNKLTVNDKNTLIKFGNKSKIYCQFVGSDKLKCSVDKSTNTNLEMKNVEITTEVEDKEISTEISKVEECGRNALLLGTETSSQTRNFNYDLLSVFRNKTVKKRAKKSSKKNKTKKNYKNKKFAGDNRSPTITDEESISLYVSSDHRKYGNKEIDRVSDYLKITSGLFPLKSYSYSDNHSVKNTKRYPFSNKMSPVSPTVMKILNNDRYSVGRIFGY